MAEEALEKEPQDITDGEHSLSVGLSIVPISDLSHNPLRHSCPRNALHPPPNPDDVFDTQSAPKSIMHGLKLKLQGQQNPFASFTYALFPLMDKCVAVDWRILVSEDVQSQHIRCHELHPDDDLAMLVFNFKEGHAKAVILVNTQENYSVAPQFLEGMDKSNYPILVLTREDGHRLLTDLNHYGDDILARVDAENDVENDVDVQLVRTGVPSSHSEQSPTSARKSNKESVERDGSKISKLKAAFGFVKSSTIDIKAEVKRLMFSSDMRPLRICSDQPKFIMVMSVFSDYEKHATEDYNHSDISDALKETKEHFDLFVLEDSPFYILLVCRLHLRNSLYQCEEMNIFIPHCLYTIENLPYEELAQVFNDFIKRGDFNVMTGITQEEESKSVFWFLESACRELLGVSNKLQNRIFAQQHQQEGASGARPLYPRFCYNSMMWISLGLRLQFERSSLTALSTTNIWFDQFIIHRSRVVMTDDTMREICDGLDLGLRFQLPEELSFNCQCLTDLLVSDQCVRPLKHLGKYVCSVERFLDTEDKMFTLLIGVRAIYSLKLKEPNFSLSSVSIDGTVSGTITEGISFLDNLSSLWKNRKFREVSIEAECTQWLTLLLGLVDIMGDRADVLLKKFMGRTGIVKKYRKFIEQQIMEMTRKNFHQLSIQQFYPLYKAFRIWPNKFLADYLKSYTIPQGTKVSDGTCNEFLGVVVTRFPAAHEHSYLLDFLKQIAERYREDGNAREFVLDLLHLNVPKLLAVADGSVHSDIQEAKAVQKDFMSMIRNYIRGNSLKPNLLEQMNHILNAISEDRNEFQVLILSVLHQEVIPEFKAIYHFNSNGSRNFRAVIKYIVDYLCKNLNWLQALTAKQSFCWGLIASSSQRVRIAMGNFEWLLNCKDIIAELTRIFNAYCTGKKLPEEESIIMSGLPEDISNNPSEDVKRYFEWIGSIQEVLDTWLVKFKQRTANYDEILTYAACHIELEELSHVICAKSLVFDFQALQNIKNSFLTEFEMLNVYLLRYIPQNPDAKWCTFLSLLNEYGVFLPPKLINPIQKYIVFPETDIGNGDELLSIPLPASTSGRFQPGHNISLRLSKNFSLRELSTLVKGLDHFQQSLLDQLDILIFFKLNYSVMFDKYLRLEISRVSKKESEEASLKQPRFSMAMSAFNFPVPISSFLPTEKPSCDGLSVKILLKSLENTQSLLQKIMKGEAAYSDIIAEGELDLEKLNVEREFITLSNYSTTLYHSQVDGHVNIEGLDGVRSLLELFQYTKHVRNISDVCEQYQLKGCLEDKQLKELIELVGKLDSEEDRSKLTPNGASEKMKRVKELLHINQQMSSLSLNVFRTVADSAEFYQFVRDKEFYGERGQATFHQQYQLITAQLQHEEYDESVLNHLLAAFKVISPFMDVGQSFTDLMTKVISFDRTAVGLTYLETVNSNITLIQLWFSRAEGDTLQNVAKELDKVLESGFYTFIVPHDSLDSAAQLFLEYVPSSSQLISLEEMTDGGPPSSSVNSKAMHRLSSRLESRLEPDTSSSMVEKWNVEQIQDFVRKLGFIGSEKEGGDKIKRYRHISDLAYKLLKLYTQLKDLGNPLYLKGTINPLYCSISRTAADNRVQETEETLKSWRSRVAELRNQYDWLLFFSIPKIFQLYSLLCSESRDLNRIVHEISFLCTNDVATRKQLIPCVQRELSNFPKDNDEPPMHVVGKFLASLFANHTLPCRSECASPRPRLFSLTSLSFTRDLIQVLHYCPNFSQAEMILTVIGICSGVPESFELFHCQPTSTREELVLFLKRSAKRQLHTFVLEVNRLPFNLQESLMQLDVLIQQGDQRSESFSDESPSPLSNKSPLCVHFIETAPSVLRDVPWVQLREHKEPDIDMEKARTICTSKVFNPDDFACIQLVVSAAGDGKTHYIKEQLNSSPASITIAINEVFTPLKAISKLQTLPLEKEGVSVFFNFTMLPPGDSVDESECERYKQLMDIIGWFFFDLLILGYVENLVSGKSFRIPGGLKWAIYIEVPSREKNMMPGEAFQQFCDEVPALGLLGTQHFIHSEKPFTVDKDVQLVCKYLRAYKIQVIDRPYVEGHKLVKFSVEPNLSTDKCQSLLKEYMPPHIHSSKITQRLFVKYMKRRCEFLDTLPAFNYNAGAGEYAITDGKNIITNTEYLGSTLMKAMLKEVSDFCDPDIRENWSIKPHQQLIYDHRDHGGSFGLISLQPHKLSEVDKTMFKRIGITIPSMRELYSRDTLDDFLSRALNIQLEDKRLTAIDDSAYVLTLDYTIKMLNIHERCQCGVPVVIEGETGVGKTALIEMLSKLWNQSHLLNWKKQKERIVEFFIRKIGEIPADISENYQV